MAGGMEAPPRSSIGTCVVVVVVHSKRIMHSSGCCQRQHIAWCSMGCSMGGALLLGGSMGPHHPGGPIRLHDHSPMRMHRPLIVGAHMATAMHPHLHSSMQRAPLVVGMEEGVLEARHMVVHPRRGTLVPGEGPPMAAAISRGRTSRALLLGVVTSRGRISRALLQEVVTVIPDRAPPLSMVGMRQGGPLLGSTALLINMGATPMQHHQQGGGADMVRVGGGEVVVDTFSPCCCCRLACCTQCGYLCTHPSAHTYPPVPS